MAAGRAGVRLAARRPARRVDVARAIQWAHGCPAILITSHPLDELKRDAHNLSVRYFLAKPVVPTVLIDALHSIEPPV